MRKCRIVFAFLIVVNALFASLHAAAQLQKTQIRGFADANVYYQKGKASFALGEQDLFITSTVTERLSFLGETVFKYSLSSPTDFDISIERIILKYNYWGNHSVLLGKHHTPVNYWNDTYHHGRVFFPTAERPLVFSLGIIPLHTTGASLQGQNLGQLRFGYDVMVGNGLGSGDIIDNNVFKSLTLAMHIKPRDGLRIGGSMYHDVISRGSLIHNHANGVRAMALTKIHQNIMTGSVFYTDSVLSKKLEILAESSVALNKSDSLGMGMQRTVASYAYVGLRMTEKIIPYIRLDDVRYKNKEVYFFNDNTQSLIAGVRYELNYLAVFKLEYQRTRSRINGTGNRMLFQVAVGF